MKPRINKPYQYSPIEQQTISKFYHHKDDWKKKSLSDIKQNIREHLRRNQNNVCCYCQSKLGFQSSDTNIEHIVSRDEYEDYGFEPYNLALSCPDCNAHKLGRKVLNIVPSAMYSHNAADYRIVHPYFDEYSEHIRQFGTLYEAKSSKGEITIDYCNLSRMQVVEQREKKYRAEKGTIADKLIYKLLYSSIGQSTFSLLNDIDKFIDEL